MKDGAFAFSQSAATEGYGATVLNSIIRSIAASLFAWGGKELFKWFMSNEDPCAQNAT